MLLSFKWASHYSSWTFHPRVLDNARHAETRKLRYRQMTHKSSCISYEQIQQYWSFHSDLIKSWASRLDELDTMTMIWEDFSYICCVQNEQLYFVKFANIVSFRLHAWRKLNRQFSTKFVIIVALFWSRYSAVRTNVPLFNAISTAKWLGRRKTGDSEIHFFQLNDLFPSALFSCADFYFFATELEFQCWWCARNYVVYPFPWGWTMKV